MERAPPRFRALSVPEFAAAVAAFDWRRRIDAVDMHHTEYPDHAAYRGHESILGMWRFHVETRGWDDIAQHVSIAPDGVIWTGRDWNKPPASATGYNGTPEAGPFMFEMIGNFDLGRDRWEGAQRAATLAVIAAILVRFALTPAALRFHRDLHRPGEKPPKTCPGTGIERAAVLAALGTAPFSGLP
jgi:hypothetical protein